MSAKAIIRYSVPKFGFERAFCLVNHQMIGRLIEETERELIKHVQRLKFFFQNARLVTEDSRSETVRSFLNDFFSDDVVEENLGENRLEPYEADFESYLMDGYYSFNFERIFSGLEFEFFGAHIHIKKDREDWSAAIIGMNDIAYFRDEDFMGLISEITHGFLEEFKYKNFIIYYPEKINGLRKRELKNLL